jgi:1,4-alpha-glucan branching enzyme
MMEFVFALHSHLPWVLHHGRWPHGSDWLTEAAVDTYLPLVEALESLEREGIPAPVTLGVTPILANQLAHPSFRAELGSFLAQRLEACDEATASFSASGEEHLAQLAGFWRSRLARLERTFARLDGDIPAALRRFEAAGRLEIMGSAATHGFLPLLARDESVRFQLLLGRREHERIFGRSPRGCWVPECAYRAAGHWQPHPAAPGPGHRVGIEDHLRSAEFRWFFTDSHQARAGRSLSLYGDPDFPAGRVGAEGVLVEEPTERLPYRAYLVSPRAGAAPVHALVRDPASTRQVWSRSEGYPGDGGYLEFHKIRWPGGLKFWRVTGRGVDLGGKEPYDVNIGRARAWRDGRHFAAALGEVGRRAQLEGGRVIAAPFDTELFGHWWHEGVDFLADAYRALAAQSTVVAATASEHLGHLTSSPAVDLADGSWGANGDYSMWMGPRTAWTWELLWPLETAFWRLAPAALDDPATHTVLEQAARELLLAQSSDWQFIISTGAAADYAEKRFLEHCRGLEELLAGLEPDRRASLAGAVRRAGELRQVDDPFPDPLPALAEALGR